VRLLAWLRRRREGPGDAGTALVEAALVLPLLLLFVLGSLDFAFLYRDQITLADAASDGAKLGAIQGPYPAATGETADFTTVNAIRQATANLNPADIERLVIFKAESSAFGSPMAQVPAICKTSGSSVAASNCNVYFPIQAFQQAQDGNAAFFACASPNLSACGWNPLLRENGPTSFDIEYLGVYLKLKHSNLTGFIGPSKSVEVAKIYRLEPGNFNT
jgi:hypothetical protein